MASSWRNRLSQGLFGGREEDELVKVTTEAEGAQSKPIDNETAKPGWNQDTEPVSVPIAIKARAEEAASLNSDENEQDQFEVASKDGGDSVPRRVNLQELLGSSFDDRGIAGKTSRTTLRSSDQPGIVVRDRIQSGSGAHQKQSSEGKDHVGTAAAAEKSVSSGDTPSKQTSFNNLSTSLTQSVKTLSERYASSKEASETFHRMRSRDSQDSLDRSSSSSSPSKSMQRSGKSAIVPDNAAITKSKDSEVGPSTATAQRQPPPSLTAEESSGPVDVPKELVKGDVMLKVTSKKVMQRIVRINPDAGQILWDSKKNNRVDLESIREVRVGEEAKSYRLALSIAPAHEKRWISIIYQASAVYKTLHLIALSDDSFERWHATLVAIQKERKMLMSCVDMLEQRQNIFLRQHFRNADTSQDARLDFDEVVRLCRRLGILSSRAALRQTFQEADGKKDGFLDFASFQHFVERLKHRSDIEKLFGSIVGGAADQQSGPRAVTRAAFAQFVRTEQCLPHASDALIGQIFDKHASAEQGGEMNISGFLSFLMSSDNSILRDQSSLATQADAGMESQEEASQTQIRQSAQTAEQLIAISGQTRVTQDMTRPLSEYFISSSHNTYLVGGQLTGTSTVEGYIRALMHGARSVELDCWDGPGNEPVVTHGHTLTSKVLLKEVIQAIAKYAFVASPYPLILSLEVHNELGQQKVIATILQSILGDKLLSLPLQDCVPGKLQALPSPRDLMGKILIKTKNVLLKKSSNEKEHFEMVNKEQTGTASATTDTTESESDGLIGNARDLVRSVTKGRGLGKGRGRNSAAREDAEAGEVMANTLAALLIYTVGVKHRGINKKEAYAVEHMISLSERTAEKYSKSALGGPNSEDLIKHNRAHLTRVYPSMHKLARLSQSANFLPNLFWSMGCQLVALNWQTLDLGYEMNQAMFARNGRSGYVLKPAALRKKDESRAMPSSSLRSIQSGCTRVVIRVTIISAQQLPRLRDLEEGKEGGGEEGLGDDLTGGMDPFVSVAVSAPEAPGYDVDCIGSGGRSGSATSVAPDTPSSSAKTRKRGSLARLRTATVRQNGFNPRWDEEMAFRVSLPVPGPGSDQSDGEENWSLSRVVKGLLDVCFLRFEVRNEGRKQAASGSNAVEEQAKTRETDERSEERRSSSTTAFSASPQSIQPTSKSSERKIEYQPDEDSSPCVATYMLSLGAMQQGYHHVPLYDAALNQHLFSTLFIRTRLSLQR